MELHETETPQLIISVLDEAVKHLVVNVVRTTQIYQMHLDLSPAEAGHQQEKEAEKSTIISMQKGTAVIAAKDPHLPRGPSQEYA